MQKSFGPFLEMMVRNVKLPFDNCAGVLSTSPEKQPVLQVGLNTEHSIKLHQSAYNLLMVSSP